MNVQFLGYGSAFSIKEGNCNAIIEHGGNRTLIDCGYTAHAKLHELGMDWSDIDDIVITHFHADHIGGLETAAYARKYIHQMQPIRIHLPFRLQLGSFDLWNEYLSCSMLHDTTGETSMEDWFEFYRYNSDASPVIGGCTYEFFPTVHIPGKASYSLRISDEKCNIFYTSDVSPASLREPGVESFYDCHYQFNGCENIYDLVRTASCDDKCAAVFHDCSWVDVGDKNVHTPITQINREYGSVTKGMLNLMHTSWPIPRKAKQILGSGMQMCQVVGGPDVYTF
jgi:hypothetical protein